MNAHQRRVRFRKMQRESGGWFIGHSNLSAAPSPFTRESFDRAVASMRAMSGEPLKIKPTHCLLDCTPQIERLTR